MTRRHLVLVGLMGAGKTTVGRACAERLGRPFVDTDDAIVTRAADAGRRDLRAPAAKPRFRELEREVVADVCASPDPLVIACGGGAIVDPENRRRCRATGSRRVAARADRGARSTRRRRVEPAAARAAIPKARSRGSARPARPRTRRPPTSWSTPTTATSTPSPTRCSTRTRSCVVSCARSRRSRRPRLRRRGRRTTRSTSSRRARAAGAGSRSSPRRRSTADCGGAVRDALSARRNRRPRRS